MKKIVLITGSTSGLGKELVTQFLEEGYVVYAGYRSVFHKQKTESLIPIELDITNNNQCNVAIKKILKYTGRIDVLVNNAGYSLSGETCKFTVEEYLKILDTNTVGAFRLIRLIEPIMAKQTKGTIINITSLNGRVSLPRFGLYSSSKHALEALGEAIRGELKGKGISVVNVAPGAIFNPDGKPSDLKHKPLRERFKVLYWLFPMVTRKEVSRKIVDLSKMSNPPGQVVLGRDANLIVVFKRFAPQFIWDAFIKHISPIRYISRKK